MSNQAHNKHWSDVGAESAISLAELHTRLSRELARMTALCYSIETAFSMVLHSIDDPELIPVAQIQGLDRLRQNLGDYARLSELLSKSDCVSKSVSIPHSSIQRTLVLNENVEQFTRDRTQDIGLPNADSDPDIWSKKSTA